MSKEAVAFFEKWAETGIRPGNINKTNAMWKKLTKREEAKLVEKIKKSYDERYRKNLAKNGGG